MMPSRLPVVAPAVLLALQTAAQVHVFVDDDAPIGGDGLSWDSALNDIEEAIALSASLGQDRGEIWIAGGRYGTSPFNRTKVPVFTDDTPQIALVGGFAGLAGGIFPDVRDTEEFRTEVIGGFDLTSSITLSIQDRGMAAFASPTSSVTIGTENAFVGIRFIESSWAAIHAGPETYRRFPLLIQNCTFSGGRGQDRSGAVDATDWSAIIRNSEFIDNISRRGGGAVSVNDNGLLSIDGCEFVGNRVDIGNDPPFGQHGGAVFGQGSIRNSTFVSNHSDAGGGAVGGLGERFTIRDSVFASNSSRGGGAVFNSILIDKCEFFGNSSTGGGGAISRVDAVVGCLITGNSAQQGGGVFNTSLVDSSIITDNVATFDGGGVAFVERMHETDLIGNSAGLGGGGGWHVGEAERLIILDNEAGDAAGGIHIIGRGSELTIDSNEASSGTAVWLDGAELTASRLSGNRAPLGQERIAGSVLGTGSAKVSNSIIATGFVNYSAIDSLSETVLVTDSLVAGQVLLDGPGVSVSLIRCTVPFASPSLPVVQVSDAATLFVESTVIAALRGAEIQAESGAQITLLDCHVSAGEGSIVSDSASVVRVLGRLGEGDPGFVNESNPVNRLSFVNNPYDLAPGSALIDRGGVLGVVPLGDAGDLAGRERVVDDPGIANEGPIASLPIDIGAFEFAGVSCLADVNGDGMVSPADLGAWILAYNNRAPSADQNRDGLITPADFSAWILNFNNGCG